MEIVVCLVAVLVGWVVLMLITTNLIGFVVRGFLQPVVTPELQTLVSEDTSGIVTNEARSLQRSDRIVTVISIVVTVGFLWALTAIWNVWVAVAAIMLMLSRLPDLLWEIRTGQKVKARNMPKGFLNYGTTLLSWLAAPLIWFAVCR